MPKSTAVAVFAIDPGGTTGVATVVADLALVTVARAMKRARAKGFVNTWKQGGGHVEQSWAISKELVDFFFKTHIERGLVEHNNFFVVMESFELRLMGADLSPVEVKAGIETLVCNALRPQWLNGEFYQTQTASEAKGFCTDQMLDRWGLLRGRSPHERDALRHVARRLDKLL